LPSQAGQAIMQVHKEGLSLVPWTGLGLFAAYTAGLIALGALLLRRRDA
jgi:hypothetical protein